MNRFDAPSRKKIGDFRYPMGVYPEFDFVQQEGYDTFFSEEDGKFKYTVALSFEKLYLVFTSLLTELIDNELYVYIRVNSDDYTKYYDTYTSEELIDKESIMEWIRDWKDVVLDDGFVAVGIFSDDERNEILIDEHKHILISHSDNDLVESILGKLGINFVFNLNLFSQHNHDHKPLSHFNKGSKDYISIFEDMADNYDIFLEVDEKDEEVSEFGEDRSVPVVSWKATVRGFLRDDSPSRGFYSTLYLNAVSRQNAMDIIEDNFKKSDVYVDLFIKIAQVPIELIQGNIIKFNLKPEEPNVWFESERRFFNIESIEG